MVAGLLEQLSSRAIEIEHLKLTIAKLRRMQFGRKSEKLDRQLEQIELRLEGLQADDGSADMTTTAAVKRQNRAGARTTTHCARIVPWGNWRRTNSGNCINLITASPLTCEWCTRRGKVRSPLLLRRH